MVIVNGIWGYEDTGTWTMVIVNGHMVIQGYGYMGLW